MKEKELPMRAAKPMGLLASAATIISVCVIGGMTPNAQGGKGTADVLVTSTLETAGDIVSSTNYRIQGDGLGSYFNGGASSVSSILQSPSGDWVLDTTSSKTRTLLIDLRAPVQNSGAQQIFAYEDLPVRIIVKCHEAIAGSFPAMKLNQTLSCPTGIAFTYAGIQYGLIMSSGPNSDVDYVETNNPQVTCTVVNSTTNQCIGWTIAPIQQSGGSVENIARLRKPFKGGYANLGDFYLTFRFNVTNP
jgi:hypothetical protein